MYSEACGRLIRKITGKIPVSEDTAYGMMLMTAALMDLQPDDEEVAQMILEDCGVVDLRES
mgnify:CR=1 FL=1|jgi:hypothetical protein